jgi:hypothetical protein
VSGWLFKKKSFAPYWYIISNYNELCKTDSYSLFYLIMMGQKSAKHPAVRGLYNIILTLIQ